MKQFFSTMADIISIALPIISYFNNSVVFDFIMLVAIGLLVYKSHIKEKRISCLECEQQELCSQKKVLEQQLERIHQDLLDGKVSSDVLINYYTHEVDGHNVSYSSIDIDVLVLYESTKERLDTKYTWVIHGRNPSNSDTLRELSFLISGDSAVRDHSALNVQAEIRTSAGDWEALTSYVKGSDTIKVLTIVFQTFSITPNRPFEIRFNYTWPTSFARTGGDVFSFGTNTFTSVDPFPMNVCIHSSKDCFNSAELHMRSSAPGQPVLEEYSTLQVVSTENEHMVSVPIPASSDGKAVYIRLH